ncbi:Epimerase domain-containing protein, partial [Psidium guajava]
MEGTTRVCVTGGSGYIGSWIVKKLLERGYTVHATVRNSGDGSKVGFLKSLPNAERGLVLFEADLYNPSDFEKAIQGCQYVFHVATPLQHDPNSSQFKDTSEAAVAGVKSIAESCIRSGTVRRLIYTATVLAASPMKDNAKCFAEAMDESCWTPLDLSVPESNYRSVEDYVKSKTRSERELMKYKGEIEIVSIALGLVGGSTTRPALPDSLRVLIAQAVSNRAWYGMLRVLEEVMGKIPVVHIEDACEAHIFCISKQHSISGRFLCASDYVKTAEIASHIEESFPEIQIPEEFIEDTGREIAWGSSKLQEMGFKYKYDLKMILEDSIDWARMSGDITFNTR